jgi:putative transposase
MAFKVRLYPTKAQQEQLGRTFGCCRFLWNQMLHEHQQVYEQFKMDGIKSKYKTEKEYKQLFPFLKEVDAIALQASREHLQDAYTRFFQNCKDRKLGKTRRHVGYPRFKSKRCKQSFTTKMTNGNIKIDFACKKIKLPKIDSWIMYSDDRVFKELIHDITVSKTKSGKYFASILIARDNNIDPMTTIKEENVIAFDMSMKDFVVTKEYKLGNPRFFRKSLNKIRKAHRHVSRAKKGSSNRAKACRKLATVYEHYVNQKKDWTHKITRQLADTKDAVIIEDLNIEGIRRFNTGHAKSVTKDFSWSEFTTILEYKMLKSGKHLVKVSRFFPSSQLCSNCGYKYKELMLDQREWNCPQCGVHHDRDVNASQNLQKEGFRILTDAGITLIRATVGTTGSHACGDRVNPPLEVTVDEARISRL